MSPNNIRTLKLRCQPSLWSPSWEVYGSLSAALLIQRVMFIPAIKLWLSCSPMLAASCFLPPSVPPFSCSSTPVILDWCSMYSGDCLYQRRKKKLALLNSQTCMCSAQQEWDGLRAYISSNRWFIMPSSPALLFPKPIPAFWNLPDKRFIYSL